MLQEIGCSYAQGYHYHRPMPASAVLPRICVPA